MPSPKLKRIKKMLQVELEGEMGKVVTDHILKKVTTAYYGHPRAPGVQADLSKLDNVHSLYFYIFWQSAFPGGTGANLRINKPDGEEFDDGKNHFDIGGDHICRALWPDWEGNDEDYEGRESAPGTPESFPATFLLKLLDKDTQKKIKAGKIKVYWDYGAKWDKSLNQYVHGYKQIDITGRDGDLYLDALRNDDT